jgi:septal ring factor EnvC (AmiA/AmiB activator)
MAEYATKKDVQSIVTQAVDDLSQIIGTLAQSMHDELTAVKEDNKQTRHSIDRLTNTIDGFIGRIDRYETEQLARDSQFERLLAWAHRVSEKTGIPLENL